MPKYSSAATNRKQKHRLPRSVLFGSGLVIVAALVIFVLEITDTIHIFHKSVPATQVIVQVGKPTSVPKSDVSNSSPPAVKTPTPNSGTIISGGTDTNGTVSSSTDPSKWIVSDSGNITVKQPLANAQLQSGAALSGSAKVSMINFRLIDSSVGVISEGTLNVVNGNFSGTLSFTPHSSSGRLDVFSTDSQGVELNEVQISVSF